MRTIEEIVINHLKNILSCPVWPEIPEQAPTKFVIVEKTGSSRNAYLYSSTIAVQSYGQSVMEAASLNGEVIAAMDELLENEQVSQMELNSDYRFTDTASKRHRYQAVFDISHY